MIKPEIQKRIDALPRNYWLVGFVPGELKFNEPEAEAIKARWTKRDSTPYECTGYHGEEFVVDCSQVHYMAYVTPEILAVKNTLDLLANPDPDQEF